MNQRSIEPLRTSEGRQQDLRRTIGVIIPVFNGAPFVERCIRSVLAQTRLPERVLIVDDCSTDDTVGVVNATFANESSVELLRLQVNGGPSHARNSGLKALDTDFVAFLDADDEWLPQHLELIESAFDAVPFAGVAFSSITGGSATPGNNGSGPRELDSPFTVLLEENVIPQSAVAVRRETVIDIGGYDHLMRYAEDFDLWLRLAKTGARFAWTGGETCVRHAHDGQVSSRFVERMFQGAWKARAASAQDAPGVVIAGAVNESLLRAIRSDLKAAWNFRERSTIRCVLAAVSWVPKSSALTEKWTRRVGWQWPVWRALAAVYDMLPGFLLVRIRREIAR